MSSTIYCVSGRLAVCEKVCSSNIPTHTSSIHTRILHVAYNSLGWDHGSLVVVVDSWHGCLVMLQVRTV